MKMSDAILKSLAVRPLTKSAASFAIYGGTAVVGVAFAVLMLWLAAPIFSLPADREPPYAQGRR